MYLLATVLFQVLFCFVALAQANHWHPVVQPLNITYPTPNKTWFVGQHTRVAWETKGISRHSLGNVSLGYRPGGEGPGLHQLATNIDLSNGSIHVKVPPVHHFGSGYFVMVLGNDSEKGQTIGDSFDAVPIKIKKRPH